MIGITPRLEDVRVKKSARIIVDENFKKNMNLIKLTKHVPFCRVGRGKRIHVDNPN